MPAFLVTLTIVNTTYWYLGCLFWLLVSGTLNSLSSPASLINVTCGIFAAAHVFAYVRVAQVREDKYLHSNIIGVDIDGVLNKQPAQFCCFLERNTQKKIGLQQITTIPVHDCVGLDISRADESAVFDDPQYWIDMPAADDAADVLARLRNSTKLKVHMFTYRPWPVTVGLSEHEARQVRLRWAQRSDAFDAKLVTGKPLVDRIGYSLSGFWRMRWPYRARRLGDWLAPGSPIDIITRGWLDKYGFKYDALMIEKGSEDVADPAMEVHNRFYACRTHSIRYFVEDDLVKAKKLAYICDVVFLIDQPYNRCGDLPKNIVRVSGWEEILRSIRALT